MYDYTTPFLKSELDYRVERLLVSGRSVRRNRTRTGRVRRGAAETRH